METDEIIGVMDSFNFQFMDKETKTEFIKRIFQINFDSVESSFSKKIIAAIIKERLIMDGACPECHGWGCKSCRRTGKNIQAVYK